MLDYLELEVIECTWRYLQQNVTTAGMWRYHANRMDARRRQFDLGRVNATFSWVQQSSCFRITVFYGVRAGEQKVCEWGQAHVMEVSRGSGVCAALCIWRTLCRHVTICTAMVIFLLFDCLLTVFDDSYTVPIVKNTQHHLCTNRHKSIKTVPTVYQSSKTVKNSQKTVKQQKWGVKVKG